MSMNIDNIGEIDPAEVESVRMNASTFVELMLSESEDGIVGYYGGIPIEIDKFMEDGKFAPTWL